MNLKLNMNETCLKVTPIKGILVGQCFIHLAREDQQAHSQQFWAGLPVNVNPGLKVNVRIMFSFVEMFFTSNVWCSLRLIQSHTERQNKPNTSPKSYKTEIKILANLG